VKKYFGTVALIVVFLAVFVPFASSNPDGLEKVAETFHVEEHEPFWNGLMIDYSIGAIENSYVSTLVAGVFGILMVLLAGFVLGTVMAAKNRAVREKR
jgi:ABC-type sulfate transport system permease component